MGAQEQIGFGKRDHRGNREYEVCTGKDMSTCQAVFLKLTTGPIAILMIRLQLVATGGDGQPFIEASLWHGHVIQREHKQEEGNELYPGGHRAFGGGQLRLYLVDKPSPEGIALSASIFFDVVPHASGSDERHPCWIVLSSIELLQSVSGGPTRYRPPYR